MKKLLRPKNKVRQFRALLGLTQAELAVKAKVSLSALKSLETNRQGVSLEFAGRLIKVFKCRLPDLFYIDDKIV